VQSPAERNLKFRQLLQRFISVCQTIAYAHSRCIVHRDIKPSNVLIGSYGEAVVVDWGLARPFHPTAGCANEPEANQVNNGDPPPSASSPTDSTMMGTALGTPAFMSPEQAEGRWDMVGPASDIYSLGTTLYVLVTGHMPIEFADWPTMAQKIRTGDIKPARQANPRVPRGLEAICAKAMALAPKDRYATAQDLAADIEHWMADEKVAAWKEPWHYRAARWVRRHRTLTASLGVLFLFAIIGGPIAYAGIEKERVVKEAARLALKANLDRSWPIAQHYMGQKGGVSSKQRESLQQTMKDYERFAADMPSDTKGQLGVITANYRLGDLHNYFERFADAQQAYDRSLRLAESQQQAHLEDVEIQRELAFVRTGLGTTNRKQGYNEKAEREFALAAKIREAIAIQSPNDLSLQRDLASGYANHAASLVDLEKPKDAIPVFQLAVTIREHIAANPNDSDAIRLRDDKCDLALVLNNLGLALKKACKDQTDEVVAQLTQEAEIAHRRARDLAQELVAVDQNEDRFIDLLAFSSRNVGSIVLAKRDLLPSAQKEAKRAHLLEARKHFEVSEVKYEQLAKSSPNVHSFASELNGVRCSIGRICFELDETLAALKQFDLMIANLSDSQSSDVRRTTLLIYAYKCRQKALTKLMRDAEAIDTCTKLIELDPKKTNYWQSVRAINRVRAGQSELAFREAERLIGDAETEREAIYNCACVFAQAVQHNKSQSNELSEKAVATLKLAASRGYFKIQQRIRELDDDPDLDPIKKSELYQNFRSSLNPENTK